MEMALHFDGFHNRVTFDSIKEQYHLGDSG